MSDPDLFSASGSGARDPSATEPVPRVERRKVYRAPSYPAEFEAFWQKIGVGSKADALKAWGQVDSPPANTLTASWAAWSSAVWKDGIGVPYTATWLRRFDWRQPPAPRKTTPMPPGNPPSTLCQFHCAPSAAARLARHHDEKCSECRYVSDRARRGPQTDPVPLASLLTGDALPVWAEGKPR